MDRYQILEISTVTGPLFTIIDGYTGECVGDWLFRDEAEKVAAFKNFMDD